MDSIDIRVLKTLLGWRQAGQQVLWVTVLQTWGSSPRPIGSMMAINEDGQVVGSVSGGCIEDDLIHQRDHYLEQGRTQHAPQRLRYGIKAEAAHRFGLPCGGGSDLFVEDSAPVTLLTHLLDAIETGHSIATRVWLNTGTLS